MIDAVEDLRYIRIDLDGEVYITLFIIVCSVVTVYTLFLILTVFVFDELGCDCEELHEIVLDIFVDSIFFGILFIPISSILLEIFHCHTSYVLFFVLFFVFFFVFFLVEQDTTFLTTNRQLKDQSCIHENLVVLQ